MSCVTRESSTPMTGGVVSECQSEDCVNLRIGLQSQGDCHGSSALNKLPESVTYGQPDRFTLHSIYLVILVFSYEAKAKTQNTARQPLNTKPKETPPKPLQVYQIYIMLTHLT
jgi:hypothetical protein